MTHGTSPGQTFHFVTGQSFQSLNNLFLPASKRHGSIDGLREAAGAWKTVLLAQLKAKEQAGGDLASSAGGTSDCANSSSGLLSSMLGVSSTARCGESANAYDRAMQEAKLKVATW